MSEKAWTVIAKYLLLDESDINNLLAAGRILWKIELVLDLDLAAKSEAGSVSSLMRAVSQCPGRIEEKPRSRQRWGAWKRGSMK